MGLDVMGLGVLGAYAAGVMALLLVPWGMLVGAGLTAWAAPLGSVSQWLDVLATDEGRDVRVTTWLLCGASFGACVLGFGALAAEWGWLREATATDALLGLPLGLGAAGILGASLARLLSPLVAWLPLENLGRPHMTKFQGLLYVFVLLGVGVWAPSLLSLIDRTGDAPLAIALGIAVFGPPLLHGLLRRADERRTAHPLALLISWMALATLAMRPISAFDQQETLRAASYQHTALERHALIWLGQHLGDKDNDGLPGLFGGGDCDDQDPTKRLVCEPR